MRTNGEAGGGNRAKLRSAPVPSAALRTAALPDELVEASKMDGAGSIRFFEMLLPLSRNNMAALFTIMFVWSWNEYLWPLSVTTDPAHRTAIIGLRELVPGTNGIPEWNIAMAGTLIVMVSPLLILVLAQRWFVRGLTATEKCRQLRSKRWLTSPIAARTRRLLPRQQH